ncbi:MAG: hypothetical protein FJW35_17920, partial [Acidobacteria bacterium]|nr:hypothetical protein [Acidobacteriota bacterium]
MPDNISAAAPLVVAVVGTHRSGTSMFARFSNDAGVCMGDRLFVDHHTNPQGHYEDMDFLELQRAELVRACGEDFLVTDE